MTPKPIDVREVAKADVEAVVDYYAVEAGDGVALRFIDELLSAYALLSTTPGAGSTRLGERLGLGGARSWSLKTFPYAIIYFDRPDQVDVWRVLHAQRDLETVLSEGLGEPSR